jgi:hypothetical protein
MVEDPQTGSDSEAIEKSKDQADTTKKKITRRFEWTEKRREAWAKALETRKKNVQKRKDELVADYIKRNGELRGGHRTADLVAEANLRTPKEEEEEEEEEEDSDSSYEVVVKTKKKLKPKPRQRQVDYDDVPIPTSHHYEFLWV